MGVLCSPIPFYMLDLVLEYGRSRQTEFMCPILGATEGVLCNLGVITLENVLFMCI